MLTEALKCARRAVKYDAVEADAPAAVAAYDEAITILQSVIRRRSQKPGVASEVERVTEIVSPASALYCCVGSHSQLIIVLAPDLFFFFSFTSFLFVLAFFVA